MKLTGLRVFTAFRPRRMLWLTLGLWTLALAGSVAWTFRLTDPGISGAAQDAGSSGKSAPVERAIARPPGLVWRIAGVSAGLWVVGVVGTLLGQVCGPTGDWGRTEQRLRQLSRAVEQSPVSVLITDLAGRIEYVNPKFIEITGYTLAEVMGKTPRILKSGDKGPEADRELWQTLLAGKEWRGEFHNKKKSGEIYWASASISPIRDLSGRTTHYVAVNEDITARKQVEAERDRLFQELEKALANVKLLSGLIPICAGCKKIRDDQGYWSQVESYIQKHSEAKFTHGLCPECSKVYFPGIKPGRRDKS